MTERPSVASEQLHPNSWALLYMHLVFGLCALVVAGALVARSSPPGRAILISALSGAGLSTLAPVVRPRAIRPTPRWALAMDSRGFCRDAFLERPERTLQTSWRFLNA